MRELSTGLYSLLFPAACAGCATPLEEPQKAPLCGLCASALPYAETHREVKQAGFDRVISACRHESPIKEVIASFKYSGRLSSAHFLGGLLEQAVRRQLGSDPADGIVPVPLHPVRFRERTFNQASVLAAELGKRLQLPVWERRLNRRHAAPPQAELSGKERRLNVRSAFEAAPLPARGARVLLVDDVFTTGSTAEACARALKQAGAVEVTVVTLSRQEAP
jgi:ComF family protein